MGPQDRRRSPRHVLEGATAEVHVGPRTMLGIVQDVSQHGMGVVLPGNAGVEVGQLVWLVVEDLAPYAITATVRRVTPEGVVGVEFEEVLTGEALTMLQEQPLVDETLSSPSS